MRRRDFIRTASGLLVPAASGQILTPIIHGGSRQLLRVQSIAGPSSAGGAMMSFSKAVKSGASLNWNWGDGDDDDVASGAFVNHTYAADGPHDIAIRSPDGWAGVTEFYFSNPQAGFSQYTGGKAGTVGADIHFATGMASMMNLQKLVSADTWFRGAPPDISMFSSLTYLDLQGNHFSGSFGSLPASLVRCDIHYGGYTGSVPTYSHCTNLQYFDFSTSNAFSGSLPAPGALTALTDFRAAAAGNGTLSGSIPDFSGCTNLAYFAVDSGGQAVGISGTIPSFEACTKLTYFSTYGQRNINNVVAGSFATQKDLATLRLHYMSLPSAAVNQVLADLVASLAIPGRVACTVTMNLYNNQAPTGQGITDKETLISAGWTVTTK